jgi:hypothetical protein
MPIKVNAAPLFFPPRAPQKLDEKRFVSKSKFSRRNRLKFHKTAREMFGKT